MVWTDLLEFTADKDVIVVMPWMNGLAYDLDNRNGSRLWETFFVDQLIPYVDAHFRTLADRAHRAVASFSNGSGLIFAARHPDMFVAVGGFSAFADDTPGPDGTEFMTFPFPERGVWACSDGTPGDDGVLGDPVRDGVWYHNVSPADLAANFRRMTLYFAIGNGIPCDERDVHDIAFPADPVIAAVQVPGDIVIRPTQQSFHDALVAEHVPHTWAARDCGLHNMRYVEKDTHEFWPLMTAAFGSLPPERFDFQTADAPENRRASNGATLRSNDSVWGWTFRADPKRAAEFLRVRNASRTGVTLIGSGLTTVQTGPYFAPGDLATLSGAVESAATADGAGRITFHVDLGAPHPDQQYSPRGLLLERLEGASYFATRTVTFAPST